MPYDPADTRYDSMTYRRSGRSGLRLPAVSLGLWHNFGDDRPIDGQREIPTSYGTEELVSSSSVRPQ